MRTKITLTALGLILLLTIPAFSCECDPECEGCAVCEDGVCVVGDCDNPCEYCVMESGTWGDCKCYEDCCEDSDCGPPDCWNCAYCQCDWACGAGSCCSGSCCSNECCDGTCCAPDECCNNGTCGDKCTEDGQCDYGTLPSAYANCPSFQGITNKCDGGEDVLCDYVVNIALNDAQCATCEPNCDKVRVSYCVKITSARCTTHCYLLACACICDEKPEEYYTYGNQYQCAD